MLGSTEGWCSISGCDGKTHLREVSDGWTCGCGFVNRSRFHNRICGEGTAYGCKRATKHGASPTSGDGTPKSGFTGWTCTCGFLNRPQFHNSVCGAYGCNIPKPVYPKLHHKPTVVGATKATPVLAHVTATRTPQATPQAPAPTFNCRQTRSTQPTIATRGPVARPAKQAKPTLQQVNARHRTTGGNNRWGKYQYKPPGAGPPPDQWQQQVKKKFEQAKLQYRAKALRDSSSISEYNVSTTPDKHEPV